MLLYGGYNLQRIHQGGKPMLFSLTGPRRDVLYLNFVRAHTCLNSVNVTNMRTPFLINRKRISVYQALSLHTRYQANLAWCSGSSPLFCMGMSLGTRLGEPTLEAKHAHDVIGKGLYICKTKRQQVVNNHWNGLVDWIGRLDWWTGLVD